MASRIAEARSASVLYLTPERCSGLAHQGTLAAIAITAAAKDSDHASAAGFGEFTREQSEISQRVIRVRVINCNGERLPAVHALNTPGYARQIRNSGRDFFGTATSRMRRSGSSQNVVGIDASNQR